eukprot:g21091.t1
MTPVQGDSEQDRLDALATLQILNSERLPEYDDLVETLATIFDAPMAFISIVGKDDLWFKAKIGIDVDGTPRKGTFCDQAILSRELMVVPNALEDPRFRDTSLVAGPPYTRFYAGLPLCLDGTHILGTLCVVDTKPRQPSETQLRQLQRMGSIVLGLMKSHRAQSETQSALRATEEQQRLAMRKSDLLEEITAVSGVGGWEVDIDTDTVTWTEKTCEIHEVDDDFVPTVDMALSFYAPDCFRGIPLPSGGLITSFFDISERKRAENILRYSEAVQRTTLESLSEGILLLTHTGEIQSANPAAIDLLGVTGRELVGLNVTDIDFGLRCDLEDKGPCDAPLELAARDPGSLRDVIARLSPTNGRPRKWLRLSAMPIDDDQEFDLDGVVVSLTDITETKQQADTLQSIFDNFPGGIVHYDETLRLASSNQQFRDLLEYSDELIEDRPYLYDFFLFNARRGDYGPGDPEALALERFRKYDLKKSQVFERRAANGTYIETRSTPLPSGGLIHNFYDITDRKNLEEQLAANERLARHRSQELEAILANMRQGVSVFDARGRLSLWNRQYIEIFNKPEGDVYEGVSLIELIQAEKDRGEFEGDVKEHVMDLMIRLSAGEVVRSKFKHPNGRIVSAVHAPLPAGGWIGTHEDVTSRELAAEKIQFAAHHDTLTGLANRTLFNAKLDEALNAASANGIAGDLMLLDLDKFKPVNDSFGHDVGDELLKTVAQRLRECVRSSDLVARLGGDEFGIILTGTGSGNASTAEIADRIVRKIGAPFAVQDHIISVGVSVGISPITGTELDPRPVIKRADMALYEVKHNGRNGFKFFEEEDVARFARA